VRTSSNSERRLADLFIETAVASFFTPTSQKLPEKIIWQERAPNDDIPSTLLVGKYVPTSESNSASNDRDTAAKRRKVAAFDFVCAQSHSRSPRSDANSRMKDSTLIQTSSGKKFASDAQDWKWWHSTVPSTLRRLYMQDGYVEILKDTGPALIQT
jgi:bifunctional polynucleotide phosphatase/kinase